MRRHRPEPDPRRGADEPTRLALAATDDPEAAEAFVAATAIDVWRLCAHLVDAAAADDLTQVTYERALRSLPTFRGDSSARTWLLTIARRVCADEIRARTRRRRAETDHSLVAAPSTSDFTSHDALLALIRDLPDPRREAFVLTQVIGLRYVEAAAVLHCPVGTVRSRVARARAELQERVDAAGRAGHDRLRVVTAD